MTELLLASTSPARRALMDALGVPYRAIAPEVDEEVPAGTPPREAVRMLAERKARAVRDRFPQAFVLGSDQLAERHGVALGKPPDLKAARAQLSQLRGVPHQIHTGVCLLGPQWEKSEVETARLTFHPISDAELEAYLAFEEWRGCAGGYRIEGRGQALLASLEGDRTNVQGLPMLTVVRLLREAGIPLFEQSGDLSTGSR